MELIIQILILFIFINCIIKLSFWKLWQALLFSSICAVFIIGMCQFAISQSKTQLLDYLSNVKILQDAAVLITIESAICFAFCFASLQDMFGKKKKSWLKSLYWYPSLLIFPVLFYLLTELIFISPGISFTKTSYYLAMATCIGIPLLSYIVKKILPEEELRLEVYFLVSLFVCIIGLITTVNGNVVYVATEEPIHFKALLLSLGLFAMAFIAGYLWDKFKWIVLQNKRIKNQLK